MSEKLSEEIPKLWFDVALPENISQQEMEGLKTVLDHSKEELIADIHVINEPYSDSVREAVEWNDDVLRTLVDVYLAGRNAGISSVTDEAATQRITQAEERAERAEEELRSLRNMLASLAFKKEE